MKKRVEPIVLEFGRRIREATEAEVANVWSRWGGLVVSVDRVFKPGDVKGLILLSPENESLALVTYAIEGDSAEIVSLDALVAGEGYGRRLLSFAESRIKSKGIKRIRIFTTNDNYRALTLYLRNSYRLVRVHLDEMERVRAIKPCIPPTSEEGIPIRDLLELEKII
ncbi:MAG: GNAT family N-acetyltransferase [Myxococcota bacterium]